MIYCERYAYHIMVKFMEVNGRFSGFHNEKKKIIDSISRLECLSLTNPVNYNYMLWSHSCKNPVNPIFLWGRPTHRFAILPTIIQRYWRGNLFHRIHYDKKYAPIERFILSHSIGRSAITLKTVTSFNFVAYQWLSLYCPIRITGIMSSTFFQNYTDWPKQNVQANTRW